MEVLTNSIEPLLQLELDHLLQVSLPLFQTNQSSPNRINYITLYHKDWEYPNKKVYQLFQQNDLLRSYMEKYPVAQIGIILSPPDCCNQLFHIDYSGKTFTLFIPTIDITDGNGTEYLQFTNPDHYEYYYPHVLEISNRFKEKQQVIHHLTSLHLKEVDDYQFHIINTNAYSIVKLPRNALHRGKSNETKTSRYMFQLIFLLDVDYVELDEYVE